MDFINLFVRPPGDLLYYLAVFGIGQVALFMALGQRLRRRSERPPRIYLYATIGMVAAWAFLMVGALFALLTNQPSDAILPPMERMAQVISLLALGWAFLTADHDRFGRNGNTFVLALIGVVVFGYLITGLSWAGLYPQTDFNLTSFGATWTFVPAALCAFGILLTLAYFRDVTDSPLKLVAFIVLLLGYAATLVQIAQGTLIGDYAGPARLAFLAAMLLVLAIIYRMVINSLEQLSPITIARPMTVPQSAEPRAEGMNGTPERESALLIKALGLMLENATPENMPERIISAAVNTLKADIGAILVVPSAHYADLEYGVDRLMGRTLSGVSLNLDEQTTLANAIERRLQRAMMPDGNMDELRDLYTRLDIEPIGPAYFQPLVSGRELIAILLLALPYSGRALSDMEQELLRGVGIIAANLLKLSLAAREGRVQAEARAIEALTQGVPTEQIREDSALTAFTNMKAELEASRDQITQLSQQVTMLKLALDDERSRMAQSLEDTDESQAISQRIIALNDEQQRLMDERDQLAARLRDAETAMAGASTDSESAMRAVVEALGRERDELAAQRDTLEAELSSIREPGSGEGVNALQDLIQRMSAANEKTEQERDALSSRLTDMEAQLAALGVQGGAGWLAQLLGQLAENRPEISDEERDRQLAALQTEVTHLAGDREAMMKQRDKLRAERDELLTRQDSLRDVQARLMAEATAYEQELKEAYDEANTLRATIQQLANERSLFTQERDRLQAERQAFDTEREQLMARIEGDRDRLQQLGTDGVGALTRMIDDLTAQRSETERELHDARGKLAALEDRLNVLQIRAGAQPQQQQTSYKPDNPEVILSMVQELRTPMTSIVGYIDLLMNESAGILGEMQRKFLQRIASNVDRLTMMLDDLIRLTFLDSGRFVLEPEPVDMVELIEDAITNASNALREKGLTVHLNLDEEAPLVPADRDAMGQVVGQLLTNAYLASPAGTELFITARQHQMNRSTNGQREMGEYLLVSIEDRGGGIALEDQPRVFARRYKAENPLITGLGDTGVGLAIAKALVEAHGGEVWLETRQGIGSAFSFILPVRQEAEFLPQPSVMEGA